MKDYIQKIIYAFTASKHNEEVTKEVHQWLLDEEYADEKEAALNLLWEETEATPDADTWKSLSSVYRKVGVEKRGKAMLRIRIGRYVAAAVVLIAVSVFGTFLITKNQFTEVAMLENLTQTGRMDHIQLPDGSMVQTNSGTILLYPEAFKGDTRTVYLIGEANFQVKKNLEQPFIVKSATMSVTALGTEFNIAAYPESNEMIATLINGKIKVDCDNGKKSYVLTPGQQVAYNRNTETSILTNADLENVTAWQKGMSLFRGVTMKEILATLERRYGITFQYNADLFNDDKYNFRFREKTNIEDIMVIVQEVVGKFEYRLEGNTCYIKKIR